MSRAMTPSMKSTAEKRIFDCAISNIRAEAQRDARRETLFRSQKTMHSSGPERYSTRKVYTRTQPYNSDVWQHDLYDGDPSSEPGSQIFIRNLPQDISTNQLKSIFTKVGQIVSVRHDKGPLPTAQIGYLKKNCAQEAVDKFNGTNLHGKAIKVSIYQSLEAVTPRGPNRKVSIQNSKSLLRADRPGISVFDRLT